MKYGTPMVSMHKRSYNGNNKEPMPGKASILNGSSIAQLVTHLPRVPRVLLNWNVILLNGSWGALDPASIWIHSYSYVTLNTHDCRYIWVISCDWRFQLRNPYDTVGCVVTQARCEARLVFELVIQMAGCHKLSSLKTGSILRTWRVC